MKADERLSAHGGCRSAVLKELKMGAPSRRLWRCASLPTHAPPGCRAFVWCGVVVVWCGK
jgi:hypothetical protein